MRKKNILEDVVDTSNEVYYIIGRMRRIINEDQIRPLLFNEISQMTPTEKNEIVELLNKQLYQTNRFLIQWQETTKKLQKSYEKQKRKNTA